MNFKRHPMLQIAIDNKPIEHYFKTPESIKSFLESAVSLDLLTILREIKSDKLHQKSLSDIHENKLTFFNESESLLKELNA